MTHPTGPAGGSPTGTGGSGPGRFVRDVLTGTLLAHAVLAPAHAVALNPRLLAPAVMVAGFGSGIYALSLIARRRRMS